MASSSNYRYIGYNAWRTYNLATLDAEGPWFLRSPFGTTSDRLYAVQSRKSGKAYIELNTRGLQDETGYGFGLVSGDHPIGSNPGYTAHSWVISTLDDGVRHNGVLTYLGGDFGPFWNLQSNNERGWWYDFGNQIPRDRKILRWAIDFDAGMMWAGIAASDRPSGWNGDPAAGTSPTYTFTPNTPLIPAVHIAYIKSGFLCSAYCGLACNRANQRWDPPTGFDRWEDPAYMAEVIADSPAGYWLSSPGWESLGNTFGYGPDSADASGNENIAQHYNGTKYSTLSEITDNTTPSSVEFFPAQPKWGFFADQDNRYGNFPVGLSSTSSFTLEATLHITGPGATRDTNDVWSEGSGIIQNHESAQFFPFSTVDQWVGLALRERRLHFGLDTYNLANGVDLVDGNHHVMAVWDQPASTMIIYLDGQSAATLGSVAPVSKSSSYVAIGSIRPDAAGGAFPGYLREVAVYPGQALSAARAQAHYDQLQVTKSLLDPIRVVRDRNELVLPPMLTR